MSQSGHKPEQAQPDQKPEAPSQVKFNESQKATPSPFGDAGQGEESGLISLASDWVSTTGSRVKVMADLVMAEAKLAAISVALMAFLAVVSATFLLGAWALFIAALIYGLLQLGLPIWPILFVLCISHALIAFLAWRGAVKLSNNLEFPVTRQQLQSNKEEADEVAESKS